MSNDYSFKPGPSWTRPRSNPLTVAKVNTKGGTITFTTTKPYEYDENKWWADEPKEQEPRKLKETTKPMRIKYTLKDKTYTCEGIWFSQTKPDDQLVAYSSEAREPKATQNWSRPIKAIELGMPDQRVLFVWRVVTTPEEGKPEWGETAY